MTSRLVSSAVFAAMALAFLGAMLALGACVQEDAFISLRYAANLVAGHGLVYNPGERVEGYSNFLWTVLLAAGMALGADPLPLARFGGMAAALALLVVTWLAARSDEGERAVTGGLVAAAVIAFSPPIATEGVQGLETVFFTLLVTIGIRLAIEARRRDSTGRAAGLVYGASGLALALAAMTRPEGLGVFGLVTLGALAWRLRSGRSLVTRGEVTAAVVFVAVWLPWWLARFAYYGYPAPNTFYAKTGGGLAHLSRGLGYELRFLKLNPLLAALGLLALVGAWRARGERQRSDPFAAIAGSVLVGYLAYVALVGGDFKSTFRFLIPVLPIAALWLDRAVSRAAATGRRRAVVGVAVLAVLVNGLDHAPHTVRWAAEREWDLARRTAAGEWLREHATAGATLAIHSAGIIPYYTGLYTIDMWGLNDLHIAHRDIPDMGHGLIGHEKSDPAYVFGRRPTYYLDELWLVTDAPLAGVRDAVATRLGVPEIRQLYRERCVPLRIDGYGDRRRWLTFLELIPPR